MGRKQKAHGTAKASASKLDGVAADVVRPAATSGTWLVAMVWCGMVNVDLYSAIVTEVCNALL